jgi:hypothetical protein
MGRRGMQERFRGVLASWCIALAGLAAGADGPRSARAEELDQWLQAWGGSAPTALQADSAGPYWSRRLNDDTIVVERPSEDHRGVRELRRLTVPVGHPAKFFEPDLVAGPGQPELFYRDGDRLLAEQDPSLATTLGSACWEWYAAGRNSSFLLTAAFGISEDRGFSIVALTGGNQPILDDLRPAGAGVWAPRVLLSDIDAYVVYRAGSLVIDSMPIERLRSSRRWEPAVQEFKPVGSEFGPLYYENPAACLDETGALHWASVLWWAQWDVPSGRIVVDGVELEHRGMEERVDWLAELACVQGRGLVLTISGESGAVEVGEVQGSQFHVLAALPSVPPRFGAPPPTQIASDGESFYVSTSEGLWAHQVARRVCALSGVVSWLVEVVLLGAGGLCVARLRARSPR